MSAARTALEPQPALVRRARRISRELAALYPDAHCELDYTNPWELLVATVLSAQSTDARVNLVTPALFAQFPDAEALAAADPREVEAILQTLGLYRSKARAVIGLSQQLLERHHGEVPASLDALVTLPGVGRKTANVVLGNAFGIPGLTVDTHFGRLSRRLGFTASLNPDQVEREVATLFEPQDWTDLSHRLVWHGRRVCFARRPNCGGCPLVALCPSSSGGLSNLSSDPSSQSGPSAVDSR